MRVNLTPWGGAHYSDIGYVEKHWLWLDNKHHVLALPDTLKPQQLLTGLLQHLQQKSMI